MKITDRLDRQYNLYKEEYNAAVKRVLESGWYVLGSEVENFEKEFANKIGSKYCVGLNSGLDALILAIRALGIGKGDEVIVPANTYIATVLGVTDNGATPIFVEPDKYYNLDADKIEKAITPNTKAILVVHLYGQAANMQKIRAIADKYRLYLLEDCAQSHTAKYNGKTTGTWGDIGCFSFYPTKNLGAFGDGGAIVTDNKELADKIHALRNYGSNIKYQNEYCGVNSRLDEIQAALLRTKLSHIDDLIKERHNIANKYLNRIKNKNIILPETLDNSDHVYHLFVIRCHERNKLQTYLEENGIHCQIHYPIPPHLQECYKELEYKQGDYPITEQYSNEVLSLPLYNGMINEEIEYVINMINDYRG